MYSHVSDELRNTTINDKVTRWLNMAITELSTDYIFGHLQKYSSKVTVAGTPDITLDTDLLWLKNIGIPVEARKLYPRDESTLAEAYPQYRTLQGQITHYYINGLTMGLWHVPDSIKTIAYGYQKRPAKLLVDYSVECDLPEQWHLVAVQKALKFGYRYEGNDSGLAAAIAEERVTLYKIGASQYKRPDDRLIMGSQGRSTKPGYPTIPLNIPIP
jgi:hypothetical protein